MGGYKEVGPVEISRHLSCQPGRGVKAYVIKYELVSKAHVRSGAENRGPANESTVKHQLTLTEYKDTPQ
jgi:hypothetical protein